MGNKSYFRDFLLITGPTSSALFTLSALEENPKFAMSKNNLLLYLKNE